MSSTNISLTIKLDAWILAYLIAEKHQFLAEWNEGLQYEVMNAIRVATNNASPEDKAKLIKVIQDGIYTDKSFGQYLVENNELIEIEEIEEPL